MSIINIQNGNFHITDSIVLSKDTTYDEIIKLAPTNRTWDIKNGFKWVYFNHIEIDGLLFNIGVCFYNAKLFCIDFGFTDKQEKEITWDNWNEKEELKRKVIYEEWLANNIGERRNFDWGKVGAYFDPRSGTIAMNVKY